MASLDLFWEIALETALNFLIFGAFLAVLIGLALVFAPTAILRISQSANRIVSARRAMKPLEVPRRSERWFYRQHRISGAVLTLLGVFILYKTAADLGGNTVPQALSGLLPPAMHSWFYQALLAFLWLGSLLVIGIGAIVFVRPSVLANTERWLNRWISTRQAAKDLQREVVQPDDWIARQPRAGGVVIALAGLYVGVALLSIRV